MVPFHFLAADSLESALFKGYTDLVLKQFPDKPYPVLVTSTALLQNAAQSRASMGDAKFFEILNRGAAGAGESDGWGELGSGWDADTFERAARKTPADSERILLVGDLIETHFPAMRNTSDYLSIDDGLAVMSQHAKDLGYDALILFLDELILWLASHAADVNFVSREAQKLPKLVEEMGSGNDFRGKWGQGTISEFDTAAFSDLTSLCLAKSALNTNGPPTTSWPEGTGATASLSHPTEPMRHFFWRPSASAASAPDFGSGRGFSWVIITTSSLKLRGQSG